MSFITPPTITVVSQGQEAALGNVDGVVKDHGFGYNPALGTTMEDIWSPGGVYTWPQTASTLEAISTSGNDTAAGSGARIVTVFGLDASFNEIVDNIVMNGTSASTATSLSFLRVNRAVVTQVGTYGGTITGQNVGDITVRISGGGATQCEIPQIDSLGTCLSQLARYTVPAGKTLLGDQIRITADASKLVHLFFLYRSNADDTVVPVSSSIVAGHFPGIAGFNVVTPADPFVFAEKTDIWFAGYTITGTVDLSIGWDYTLITNA